MPPAVEMAQVLTPGDGQLGADYRSSIQGLSVQSAEARTLRAQFREDDRVARQLESAQRGAVKQVTLWATRSAA
jgi:hypothetical protein